MKKFSSLLIAVILLSAAMSVHAQQRSTNPQITPQAQTDVERLEMLRRLVRPASGAWWTNAALLARLGLTDEQKTKIERAFENHKQKLSTNTEVLNKEEAQLAKLLEADPIDRSGILTQFDRVISARGEVERENSAMTLEMREVLTRAQWTQLQNDQPVGTFYWNQQPGAPAGGGAIRVAPGARGGGGRGVPGQQQQ